jgi:hypothetical protein
MPEKQIIIGREKLLLKGKYKANNNVKKRNTAFISFKTNLFLTNELDLKPIMKEIK